jgi:hypothetical protein
MANITIAGNSYVIASDVAMADLEAVKKYRSSALTLVDEETKEAYFKVGLGSSSLSDHGVSFGGTSNDEEKVATAQLTVKPLYMSRESMENSSIQANMNVIIPDDVKYLATSGYNIFIVHNTVSQDSGEKMLEIVRANAGFGKRYLSSYFLKEDLRVFYARKMNALFYTDNAKRNTVIFVDKLALKHFHALQMMIPKYLPSLFADNPLTEAETALLKSTGNNSAVEYETLIEEFSKDIDIRTEIIRTKLAGFETVFERIRVDEVKNEISAYQLDYNHYVSMMREMADKIQDRKYILAGLECDIKQHTGDSELMEYFMCNKNLSIIKVTGTVLEFIAHGYADIYDADAFEQYVENHSGYMYSNINLDITKNQMEMLYRAIFSEGWYKLRICAAYTADIRNGLKGLKYYQFPLESSDYFPNPHIQQYGCIGTYAGRFQEYMQKKDYVGAIDQAVVSARNLNFYDSTVMSAFANTLSHSAIKCIEKPDGTLLTPLEAITGLEGGNASCQDR